MTPERESPPLPSWSSAPEFEGEAIMRGAVCMAALAGWDNPAAHADRYYASVKSILEAAHPTPPPASADTLRAPDRLRAMRAEFVTDYPDEDERADREALDLAIAALANPAPTVRGEPVVTDELIGRMVDAFLCWRLPDDFAPDAGISFNPGPTQHMPHCWPVGTNLLTAAQAKAMFEQVFARMMPPKQAPMPTSDEAREAYTNVLAVNESLRRDRDALLELTATMDAHPENYDGPCMCKECQSYADTDDSAALTTGESHER